MLKIIDKNTFFWHGIMLLFFVLGIGLSLWGAYFSAHSAHEAWQNDVAVYREKVLAQTQNKWLEIGKDLSDFSNLYSNNAIPDDATVAVAAERLLRRHGVVRSFSYYELNPTSPNQPFVLYETDANETLLTEAVRVLGTGMARVDSGKAQIRRVNQANPAQVIFIQPLVLDGVVARTLVLQLDMEKFLKTMLLEEGVGGYATVEAALKNMDGETIWRQTLARSQTTVEPDAAHEAKTIVREDHVALDTAFLQLHWQFKEGALGGPEYLSAIIIGLVGLLITLSVEMILFSQLQVNRKVQHQVNSRTQELEALSARFKMISDNAYDLIALLDPDLNFEYANEAYDRMLGFKPGEVEATPLASLVHEQDYPAVEQTVKRAFSGGKQGEITFRMRDRNNKWLYVEGVVKVLHEGEEASTQRVVMHCRDISSRKKYADELARSEQRFRDFAESSSDWLWEIDANGVFTYVSPGVKETLGYKPEDMIGKLTFDTLFNANNDTTRSLIESRIERHQPYRDIEFWTRSKMGEQICLRMSGVPVFDERQRFVGYRGASSNSTASKLDRQNMFRLATTDSLTNLLNRTRFMEELERTLGLAKRHKTSGVLLFIDLDRFKEVNDTHGHEAGDALLKAVAEVLERNVRTTDVVARLGGDEFGIIMHNIDTVRAKDKVDKIIEEINRLRIDYKGLKLQATMSIGMVVYPQEDRDTASLIMSADLAMYRAKDMGRNRAYIDDANNDQDRKDSIREQLRWVNRLRKALEDGDFEMHYQPLVPKADDERPTFEALIRLRDENGDLGAPGIFIDAAEHFGLIQSLDLAVINRCFEQQLQLKEQGMEYDVSINLSGRTIGDADVIQTLKDNLKAHKNLNPANFIFEVTETAALHDPSSYRDLNDISNFMDELHAMGFRFALDDFGTGFSSFTYIKHLNIDIIKIDGSFIRQITHSHNDQLFVKTIVDLAKGMNIKTVAEFVEDEKILEVLDDIGVDFAQGYYLSRPEADLADLYKRFNKKSFRHFKVDS